VTARVLLDVAVERHEQDRKWGGPAHDDEHSVLDWLDFIRDKAAKAHGLPCKPPFNTAARAEVRRRLIQIAALAVAGVESLDRREAAGAFPREGEAQKPEVR